MSSRIISRMFVSLAAVVPAFPLVLLMLCASSCYYSWSMSGEGYEGGHVYLVKMPAECMDFNYFESQQPLDHLKDIDTLYAYELAFRQYVTVLNKEYWDERKKYDTLDSEGYWIGNKSSSMIWDREERKKISFALPPGTLFRVTHFFWNNETGTSVYADVLNGALAGKEIEVGGFGRHYRFYNSGFQDFFEYPAGRTIPFWLDKTKVYILDQELVQDLGKLTDDELKTKGLWLEPGTETTMKAIMKPFPDGIEIEQLQKDAKQNDVDAQILLGKCYFEGAGVRRDRPMAEYWFQKAIDQGSREAEFRLAVLDASYHPKKAEKVFRKYAEDGDRDAQFCLGLLLDYSTNSGFESFQWYQKAADQGDPRAMRSLGMYHVRRERLEKATEWFKKAAELGDFAAQRNLGYLYLKGKGVEKDKAEARKWLEKAAAQGDSYAQELLAESFPDSEK